MNDLPIVVHRGYNAAIDVLAFRLVKPGECAVIVMTGGATPVRYFIDRTKGSIPSIEYVGGFLE